MKAINFKIATFSFAAMLLASCSDSNNAVDNGIGKATTVVGSSVEAEYANQLASRVTNIKAINSANKTTKSRVLTRAAEETNEPSLPANAKNIREVLNDSPWNQHVGNYYVEAGDDIDANNINICGMTIYVYGKFTYNNSNSYSDQTHINVMKSGTLVARNSQEVFQNNWIQNWGKIVFPTDQSKYIIKNYFLNYGSLDIAGKTLEIENDANVYIIGGNINAAEIKLSSNNAQLNCTGNMSVNTLYLTNSSKAWVDGILTTNDLKMDGNTELHSGCALKVATDVYLTNNINLYCRYFSTPNLKQDSNAKIHILDQGVLDIAGDYWNLNDGLGSTDLGVKDGVALIKCNRAIYNAGGKKVVTVVGNNDWAASKKTIDCKIFSTSGDNAHIIVNIANGVYTNAGNYNIGAKVTEENTTIDWTGGNIVPVGEEEAKNYVIKKTECYPEGYNDNGGSDTPTTKPSLDLISSIDYDTHDHDISATCIQPMNGRMYMSYHTRGTGHGGCVEVFTPVQNDTVRLEQYLYDSARDLDFNHLLATQLNSGERMVYLPGSSNKKGAMFAYIPVQANKLLAAESKTITKKIDGKDSIIYEQPLQFIQMNPATAQYTKAGYDENCVVYNKETNHLIVMTTKGYIIYDANSLNEIDRIEKPGKAKHVAIGGGKIVTLYLDRQTTDVNEAIPATVEVFDQKGEDLNNPEAKFSISTIEPNNGKNVIAINDNKIYVCRGAAGMYVYDMQGNELWHYQMPNATVSQGDKKGTYKAYANGCYVGNKYVYIAYGSYGLVVLDKATHEPVAQRKVNKSANYVVEHDGYIYVAYGQSRMQVFKLCGADPETSYNE